MPPQLRLLPCGVLLATAAAAIPANEAFVPQVPPDAVAERVRHREERLAATEGARTRAFLEYFIDGDKTWGPRKALKVAFPDGDGSSDLYDRVASAAEVWCRHASVTFDFKRPGGQWRTWRPTDTHPAADIRISFRSPGQWSLVGSDAAAPSVAHAGEPTMGLQAFDLSFPPDGRAVVIHEFGHALGFEHEHQRPDGCAGEFRWDDDPGYVRTERDGKFIPDANKRQPGVYTILGGKPHEWSAEKVDKNIRALPASSAFVRGQFDARSIMKYYFPRSLFLRPDSRCFSARSTELSEQDREGVQRFYPFEPAAADRVLNRLLVAYEAVIQDPGTPPTLGYEFRALRADVLARRWQ